MKRFSNPTIRLEVKYSIRGRGGRISKKNYTFHGIYTLTDFDLIDNVDFLDQLEEKCVLLVLIWKD